MLYIVNVVVTGLLHPNGEMMSLALPFVRDIYNVVVDVVTAIDIVNAYVDADVVAIKNVVIVVVFMMHSLVPMFVVASDVVVVDDDVVDGDVVDVASFGVADANVGVDTISNVDVANVVVVSPAIDNCCCS